MTVRRIKIATFTEPVFSFDRYGEYVRASDYDALTARVARLEEALKQAAEDLQLVGDDYPGSSCHKWCSESAATARAALADSAVQK